MHQVQIMTKQVKFFGESQGLSSVLYMHFILQQLLVVFLQNNPHLVRNKNVIELGAGASLCLFSLLSLLKAAFGGLASLLLNAQHCLCTDYQSHLVELCRQTLELNTFPGVGSSEVLKWGDASTLTSLLRHHFSTSCVDLIIGSDVWFVLSLFLTLLFLQCMGTIASWSS